MKDETSVHLERMKWVLYPNVYTHQLVSWFAGDSELVSIEQMTGGWVPESESSCLCHLTNCTIHLLIPSVTHSMWLLPGDPILSRSFSLSWSCVLMRIVCCHEDREIKRSRHSTWGQCHASGQVAASEKWEREGWERELRLFLVRQVTEPLLPLSLLGELHFINNCLSVNNKEIVKELLYRHVWHEMEPN